MANTTPSERERKLEQALELAIHYLNLMESSALTTNNKYLTVSHVAFKRIKEQIENILNG